MKILALDLATRQGSVAFASEENEVEERNWPNEQRNSGPFFGHLQQLRTKFGAADVVISGLGPGSYAGTRISVATATGLALGWKAKLLGAPSVCAFPSETGNYFVIGDARRDAFFCAEISNRVLIGGVDLLALEELQKRLSSKAEMPVYSSDALAQFPHAQLRFPSARELVRLVRNESLALRDGPLQPLYLREPSITLPKPQRTTSS